MMKDRKKKKRLINGSKGVISLFLVAIMSPALTLITAFIDLGRYNAYMATMDEVMGVAATSTLAGYDPFLQERFGVCVIDQQENLSDEFKTYLNENSHLLGTTATVTNATVQGKYPLSESEILYNQVLEYSKLNVPVTIATDMLNLLDFIKTLEEKVEGLEDVTEMITKSSKVVDSAITVYEKVEQLITVVNEIKALNTELGTAYTSLEEEVIDLAEHLEAGRPTVDPDNGTDADELAALKWDTDLGSHKTAYNSAKSTYTGKITSMIGKLNTYKSKLAEIDSALNTLYGSAIDIAENLIAIEDKKNECAKDVEALNKEIENLVNKNVSEDEYKPVIEMRDAKEAELAELTMELESLKAAKAGAEPIVNEWNSVKQSAASMPVDIQITKLNTVKTNVDALTADDIDEETHIDGLDDTTYKFTSANVVAVEDLQAYIDGQEDNKDTGGFSKLLEAFTAVYESIFSTKVFFDPALSATINSDFYDTEFGGLPGGMYAEDVLTRIINALKDAYNALEDFKESFGSWNFIEVCKKLVELIKSVLKFIEELTSFVTDIVKNLISFVTGYDQLYISIYMAYNLPCRTTLSGSTMSGYKYSNIGLPSQGPLASTPFIGGIAALMSQIEALMNGTGDDYAFSGAELEYIMFGSDSEIANQLYVFMGIYMLRLALDVVPITSNAEVQAMAAATTIGYGAVLALVIILEPLCDTVILVNGGSIPLWKTKVYLTPSGIPSLITSLCSCISFNAAQRDALKNKLVGAMGANTENYDYQKYLAEDAFKPLPEIKSNYLKGLINLNYQQYCMLLNAVLTTKERQIARLSNLIQMEAYNRYKDNYTFDLRKSYTYVEAKTNLTFKQTMAGLFNPALLSTELTQYRGY